MSASTSARSSSTPRLTLGHATLAARDIDRLSAFYCDVLGFEITNRGPAGPDSELLFLSQDPGSHHQIAMVSGVDVGSSAFVMVDHFAFRTGTLHPRKPDRGRRRRHPADLPRKLLVPLLQRLRGQRARVLRRHAVSRRPALCGRVRSRQERRGDSGGNPRASLLRTGVSADVAMAGGVCRATGPPLTRRVASFADGGPEVDSFPASPVARDTVRTSSPIEVTAIVG